jgi:Terminase large subunit, T4likevirus-type, N-terminal
VPDVIDAAVYPHVEVLPDPVRRWLPASAAQSAALNSQADLLMLGGAAGSLKTSTMLVDLIAERAYPRMRSYFFRRTYAELTGGENAIDQSLSLFSQCGGTYNSSTHTWRWDSGAELYFRHCQHEKDVHQYQSQAMTALAIDESTHWPEQMARYLITRNRSANRYVKIRARLGTNPGGVGHKWHQKLFMGGVCAHCEPQNAPPQGLVRWDAKWSDGIPFEDKETGTKISVSYILSRVRDHDKLGPSYIARLKMQSPATAKALLEGCWKIFEGQYFDVWEPNRGLVDGQMPEGGCQPGWGPMVMDRRDIGEQWWWPRWVGSDFGFSISVAASCLFVHMPQTPEWPRGRVFLIDEYKCQETAKNFAQILADRWVLDEKKDRIEARWQPWYLSPDSYGETGQPESLASQMNGVLKKVGIQFNKANTNREGGAMKLYSAFETGELVICRNCHQTIEAIESRIHDPEKENDVLKISGDELDDFYDCARYGYLSWETHRPVTAPLEVRVKEKLDALWDKDPTTAMFQANKIIEQEKKKGAPTVYGGTARARMKQP